MRLFLAAALATALLAPAARAQPNMALGAPTFSQPAQTRTNLGLGTVATQNAEAAAITGGSVTGLTALGAAGSTFSVKPTTDAAGAIGTLVDLAAGKQLVLNPTGGSVMQKTFWNQPVPGGYTPSLVIAGANPQPVISIGLSVTGTWGTGVGAYNSIYILDQSDHSLQGNNAAGLLISTVNGGGISRGFSEALSLNCGTNGPVAPDNAPNINFLTCQETRASPSHNAGGTTMLASLGQNNAANWYAILNPGASWWTNNSPFEFNFQVMSGASSLTQNAGQFARLNQDWGNVGVGADINAFAGRVGLWMTGQQPGYDGTTTVSATASAGMNLPAYRSLFPLGGGFQEWLGDATTSFSDAFPQVNYNSNSCTIGVANCPATTAAAPLRPQIFGNGFAWGGINFTNEPWRTPGLAIKGTGEIQSGNGQIIPTTAGLTLDVKGSYVSGAVYSAADKVGHKVGEYLVGSGVAGTVPGAILQITAVNGTGVPTALSIVRPGYSTASAAINNASSALGTNAVFMGGGRVIVTLTWTNASDGTGAALALAPTNGRVAIGSGGNAVVVVDGSLAAGVRIDRASVKSVPTTGQTVTIAQTTRTQLIAPAGPLPALTVAFPACSASYSGQEFRMSTTYAISTLTITISTGGTPPGYPTSLTAGQGVGFLCSPSDNGWYRLY